MDLESKLKKAILNNNTTFLRRKFMFRKHLVNCRMTGKETLLIYAIANNPNVEIVKFLLSHHVHVNMVDMFMRSALHHVLLNYNQENTAVMLTIIKKLFKRGANPLLQDLAGNSCLHIAAGLDEGNAPLQLLLQYCDDNSRNIKNKRGETASMIATKGEKIPQVFTLLTTKDGACNYHTILYRAIDTGCKDIVKIVNFHREWTNSSCPQNSCSTYDPKRMFLENGNSLLYALCYDIRDEELLRYLLNNMVINIEERDRFGNSALHYAVLKNLPSFAMTLLEKGANINAKSHKGNTPLHYAVYGENLDMITVLCFRSGKVSHMLKQKNHSVETVLGIACRLKNRSLLKLLLRIYIMKTVPSENKEFEDLLPQICQTLIGETTVKAGQPGNSVCKECKKCISHDEGRLDYSICVECFIAGETNLNELNDQGETPLHEALRKELYFYAEELIKQGADVNIKNADGTTILHLLTEANSKELLELALSHGAAVNAQNRQGKTPLHIALECRFLRSAAFFLHTKICDVDSSESHCKSSMLILKDNDGNTPLHVAVQNHDFTSSSRQIIKVLVQNTPDINIQNNDGETPLIKSVKLGRTDIVTMLMTKKPDVTICDNVGSNSFDYASEYKFDDIFETLIYASVRFNKLNSNEDSLLHIAAKRNYSQILEQLFTTVNTLDINAQNKRGDTALHFCFDEGDAKTDIAQKLIDRGAIIHLKNEFGKTPLDLAMELQAYDIIRLFYNHSYHGEILGDFECPVCFELPKQVFQCKNSHVVCRDCKSKPNMDKCPLCRVSMTSCKRNEQLESEMYQTLYTHLSNTN